MKPLSQPLRHIRSLVAAAIVASMTFLPRSSALAFPADFDGDGKSDIAVWRNSTGYWFVIPSGGFCPPAMCMPFIPGQYCAPYLFNGCQAQWGLPGDKPMSGDFDGDGRSDFIVVRPNSMVWYFSWSSYNGNLGLQFGLPGDIPDETDLNADGISDPIVYRPSTRTWFFWINNVITSYLNTALDSTYTFLSARAASAKYGTVVPGSYAGIHLLIHRPADPPTLDWGMWFRINTLVPFSSGVGFFQPQRLPVIGNFAGSALADWTHWDPTGSSSPGMWDTLINVNGSPSGNVTGAWGLPGDVPVSGDYDGDGVNDRVVYRPSTSDWYIKPSTGICPWYTTPNSGGCVRQWGLTGDVPVSDVCVTGCI